MKERRQVNNIKIKEDEDDVDDNNIIQAEDSRRSAMQQYHTVRRPGTQFKSVSIRCVASRILNF